MNIKRKITSSKLCIIFVFGLCGYLKLAKKGNFNTSMYAATEVPFRLLSKLQTVKWMGSKINTPHCYSESQSNKTTSSYSKDDLKEWLKMKEKKYAEVNKYIRKVCRKYHEPERMMHLRSTFMLDTKHKLSSCLHKKVGSTTWMYHFFNLLPNETKQEITKQYGKSLGWRMYDVIPKYYEISHRDIPQHKSLLTPKMFDIMLTKQFKKFVKNKKIFLFSFIRHPFERLVSAYKDKVLGNGGIFIKNIGYTKWYRTNHSFPSFIDLVLQQYKSSQCTSRYKRECLDINEHWRPLSSKCSFCDIPYDVVGRLETFNEDVKYIILKNKLSDKLPIEKIDTLKNKSKRGDTKNVTLEYFSQLTKTQKADLYKMYRMDFEILNYDHEIYIQNKNI